MRVKNLEDINILLKKGTENPELDKQINLYYKTIDYTHRMMIKLYWLKDKREVKYQFKLKLSEYQRISKNMIDDVNSIIDRYYAQRRKLIKEVNKKCNNVADMTTYRKDKAERIQANKFKLGIYD